ncbi:MAG: hypothetical protein BWY08_01394 [Bacteroidetes bacterium ADurb.Bin174]|nr:MAG: hypothetical protein BWY08_01394 [Bacteroidetes bacterium ADurb.Bin174]
MVPVVFFFLRCNNEAIVACTVVADRDIFFFVMLEFSVRPGVPDTYFLLDIPFRRIERCAVKIVFPDQLVVLTNGHEREQENCDEED